MKLISHEIFLKHNLKGHPENADRIRSALKEFKYEQAVNGEIHLNKVHTQRYVQGVKKALEHVQGPVGFLDAGETYVGRDTYKAACYAVGAAVAAAESALKKKPAFALVRPPGHHAHPDWTNGFCIFNNMAIAAAYLAEKGSRVLIVDIDMHRGDGTQDAVTRLNEDLDNKLFYFSINQQGVFPGMTFDEGNVQNIYVEAGTSENDYLEILRKELPARIRAFKPKVIAVSAGFDSFAIDTDSHSETLGCGLLLTRRTVNELKRIIGKVPYFAVLEGGYNSDSVLEGVSAFMGVASKVKFVKKKVVAEDDEDDLVVKTLFGGGKGRSVKGRGKKVKVKKAAKGKKAKKTKAKKVKKVVKKKSSKAKKAVKKKVVKKKVKTPERIVNRRTKRSGVTASGKGTISRKRASPKKDTRDSSKSLGLPAATPSATTQRVAKTGAKKKAARAKKAKNAVKKSAKKK
ncbi:histone deacetylase family protein [Nanoarchaeota archaeon]